MRRSLGKHQLDLERQGRAFNLPIATHSHRKTQLHKTMQAPTLDRPITAPYQIVSIPKTRPAALFRRPQLSFLELMILFEAEPIASSIATSKEQN